MQLGGLILSDAHFVQFKGCSKHVEHLWLHY